MCAAIIYKLFSTNPNVQFYMRSLQGCKKFFQTNFPATVNERKKKERKKALIFTRVAQTVNIHWSQRKCRLGDFLHLLYSSDIAASTLYLVSDRFHSKHLLVEHLARSSKCIELSNHMKDDRRACIKRSCNIINTINRSRDMSKQTAFRYIFIKKEWEY